MCSKAESINYSKSTTKQKFTYFKMTRRSYVRSVKVFLFLFKINERTSVVTRHAVSSGKFGPVSLSRTPHRTRGNGKNFIFSDNFKMADEDEDDYMSDKFLLGAADSTPGLVPDKIVKKYKREMKHHELNQRNKIKPMRQRESEHREQGLANALDSSNKGFAMLQKMGFKQGMGLGKEGTGRAEPIPLTVKSDRGGLGRDILLKRQRETKEALKHETAKKRMKIEEKQRDSFRRHMSGRFAERQTLSDLYKSQKACEQLDKSKDLPCVGKWFWPEAKTEDDEKEEEEEEEEEKDDEEEELEPSEKLVHLTMYLRRTHQYCIWCGTKYDDDQDMADNCPGDTAQDHE